MSKPQFGYPDSRVSGGARTICVALRTDKQYLTFAEDASQPHKVRFCVVGTPYGFLHKTSGDIRFWKSRSGANRVIRKMELK